MEGQEVTGNLTIGECEGRDLKSCDLLGRAGSIPALGTNYITNDDWFLDRRFVCGIDVTDERTDCLNTARRFLWERAS